MDNNESPFSLIIQSMANMYVCKRFFQRYGRKDKSKPIAFRELSLILGFMLLLLLANQVFFFFTKPENLYSVAGVTRSMTPQQIGDRIAEAKLAVMNENMDLQLRLGKAHQLD